MYKQIEEYYKTSGLAKFKNKGQILKNEELFQLYKKPKKDKGRNIPTMQDIEPKAVCQADLIYLPDDKDYKYALVVVDVSTGLTDAEPLKERNADTVLTAFKKIRAREPLKNSPTYVLQTDSGSEFKGVFAKYIASLGITLRYGAVGRSRQQAIVEARNKTIGQALFYRMTGQEILTEEESKHWIKRIKEVIKDINKNQKDKKPNRKVLNEPYIPDNTIILSVGQPVRVMLDKPLDTFHNKLHGNFRATDIRWSRKIHKISNIIIDNDNPILYQVDNKPSPAYTYNQLQIVDIDKLEAPPAELVIEGTPSTYIVKKIIDKKKEKNNKIYYRVIWKGYPKEKDYTWEPKSELINFSDVRVLINDYEKTLE